MVNSNAKNIEWHQGKIDYKKRCAVLNQKGHVIWLTGLSGAGKSTVAVELEERLLRRKKIAYRLDGDNVRHGLNKDLAFSKEEREENIRRITEVANLFKDAGLITLVSFITPYEEMRQKAREVIGEDSFTEIYIKADLETCIQRDPKGLYDRAIKGEINDFTGISAPYEKPEDPEIIIDTDRLSVTEAVEKILAYLAKNVYVEEGLKC